MSLWRGSTITNRPRSLHDAARQQQCVARRQAHCAGNAARTPAQGQGCHHRGRSCPSALMGGLLDLRALLTYPELAPAVRADRTFNERAGGRWYEQLAIRAVFAAIRGVSVASRSLRHLRCQRRIRRSQNDRGGTDSAGHSLQNGTPRNVCRPHILVVCHVRDFSETKDSATC